MRRDECLQEPWSSTEVCLLTCRVTLVTQLISRGHVLQEKREHLLQKKKVILKEFCLRQHILTKTHNQI